MGSLLPSVESILPTPLPAAALNNPAFARRKRRFSQSRSMTSRVRKSSIASLGWITATMFAAALKSSACASPRSSGAGVGPITRTTTSSPVNLGTEGTWAEFEDFILAMGTAQRIARGNNNTRTEARCHLARGGAVFADPLTFMHSSAGTAPSTLLNATARPAIPSTRLPLVGWFTNLKDRHVN